MASADHYIELGIADESYGIKLGSIHEIIRMQEITFVPNHSKPYLKGVMNLRGSIVPIVSLRCRFGMNEITPNPATRIIVVNSDGLLVGLIVDNVQQVIALDDVQAPPERLGHLDGRFIAAIGQKNGKLIGILHMEYILEAG
ncbi:chemotaxis protein CheW [Paenibacillus athensensis]|uniref:CheW-like domain-containing protein n=1 Tax=Paenibacillus athensensis TaxID=1967502 RepID=A0A4Y8Q4R3_9BACL|nr:chemotaxis protein CheW [Paenibacillus athensensis]MCD1258701.1 chemotaxis protein CheW [Paenibacillus athensensis]